MLFKNHRGLATAVEHVPVPNSIQRSKLLFPEEGTYMSQSNQPAVKKTDSYRRGHTGRNVQNLNLKGSTIGLGAIRLNLDMHVDVWTCASANRC